MLCIRNAIIHTASNADPHVRSFTGDILMDKGKILEVGQNLACGKDCPERDASGLHAYPGFVEAHCHIGLDGTAIGYEGQDYNEYNDPVTPS